MRKVLITGASGFIGGFLVDEFLNKGYDVFAGIRSTSSRAYLKDGRINFFETDFSNIKNLSRQLRNEAFDYIIHNAGITKANQREDYFRINTQFTQNFIEAILQSGALPQKFTFVSSLASYGPASNEDLTDRVNLLKEPNPITTYGESKLEAERYLKQQKNLPHMIIRPTAVYGPREREILLFFKLVNRGLEPYIGFKPQDLTFIYVRDLVRVIFNATVSPLTNRHYFVTDGKAYPSAALGRIAKKLLNKKTLSFKVPTSLVRFIAKTNESVMSLAGKYPGLNLEKVRELESLNWKCDIAPLKEDLGFSPEYDLERGLEETIRWYQQEKWL